jgi:hypothetical protein
MVAWVPPFAHRHRETKEDVLTRYESIANDLATVVQDDTEPSLFEGSRGRMQTALLLLSVASYESSFSRHVDFGEPGGVGDHGHSYCLMQIRVGAGKTREGWTGSDLVHDRKLCFRAGLHILRASMNVCRDLPLGDRLSAYAAGRCERDLPTSQLRVRRALDWWDAHRPPV